MQCLQCWMSNSGDWPRQQEQHDVDTSVTLSNVCTKTVPGPSSHGTMRRSTPTLVHPGETWDSSVRLHMKKKCARGGRETRTRIPHVWRKRNGWSVWWRSSTRTRNNLHCERITSLDEKHGRPDPRFKELSRRRCTLVSSHRRATCTCATYDLLHETKYIAFVFSGQEVTPTGTPQKSDCRGCYN